MAANAIVRRIRFTGFSSIGVCAPLTPEEVTRALELGLDSDAVYPVGSTERHVLLPVGADDRVKLGLRYETGAAPFLTAERFRVLSMDGARVLGGGRHPLSTA